MCADKDLEPRGVDLTRISHRDPKVDETKKNNNAPFDEDIDFLLGVGSSAPHHLLCMVLHDHLMARLRLLLVRRRSLDYRLLLP